MVRYGGLFRPRRTYQSEHLLLDHRPAFAILTNEALGFELGAKVIKVIEVRPALEADAGFSRLSVPLVTCQVLRPGVPLTAPGGTFLPFTHCEGMTDRQRLEPKILTRAEREARKAFAAQEAEKALSEYEKAQRAFHANRERLKAERLAREAAASKTSSLQDS